MDAKGQQYLDVLNQLDCNKRCAAFFGGIPQLRDSCEKACQAKILTKDFDKCYFLEEIVGDQQSIGYYNIDCNTGTGSGSSLLGQRNADLQTPIKIGIVTAVVVVILFLLWIFVINN